MSIDRRVMLAILGCALSLPMMIGAGSAIAQTQLKDLQIESARPRPKPNSATPVNVSLTPIGAALVSVGSPVRFRASSSHAGFGHLYITNKSGKVVLLMENVRLKARQPIELPKSGLVLRAMPPAGDNTVLFLATRDRLTGFAGGAMTTTPTDIQVSGDGLINELTAKLSSRPRERWGFTTATIRVVE